MEEIESSKGEAQSARRRLIRGAFGVPAVLALQCGSASAASSLLVCLKNQNNQPRTLPVVSSPDTLNLRYQLYAFVHLKSLAVREKEGYWIYGAELDAFNRNGRLHWLGSGWQRFDVGANSLVGSPQAFKPTWSAGEPLQFELRKVSKWVALRVDGDGGLVGAGATGGGSSVGASCWNSFAIGSKLA